MPESNALIIFAKAPVPGKVKTRLQPVLSPDECADLHSSFILDTVRLAKKVRGASVFLSCHPGLEDPFFQSLSSKFRIRLINQKGNNLGERMDNAIRDGLKTGYKKVIIIGSDSPDLPPEHIEEGFEQLDSHDMVVGPAEDGGYYLIGGTKELPVFDDIPWSTGRVFILTIEKAVRHGITFAVLKKWHDVDTWDDLQRLRTSRRQTNQVP